jgi:predicted negative regulator of RcsB-dependent stress response
MRGVVLALLLTSLVVGAAPAEAQSAQYKDILHAYRAGKCDEAIAALLTFDDARVEREVRDLMAANSKPFRREVFEAALVLHLHAVMALGDAFTAVPAWERLWRDTPRVTGSSHSRYAAELLSRLEESPRDVPFLSMVYALTLARLQGRDLGWGALDLARTLPPDIRSHPEIQLAIGAIHETAWHWRHEDGLEREGLSPDLEDAESAYRIALTGRAAADEAAVRLGRVLGLRGRRDEALSVLAQPRGEPAFAYLALLFAGDVHEQGRDYEKAEAAYAAAAALMPRAHSAQFAAAHLHHVRNERGRAAGDIRVASTPMPDAQPDPWLWYRKGTSWRTAGYLEALQQWVRQ